MVFVIGQFKFLENQTDCHQKSKRDQALYSFAQFELFSQLLKTSTNAGDAIISFQDSTD